MTVTPLRIVPPISTEPPTSTEPLESAIHPLAAATPAVSYHGGKLLSSVEVILVFWGTAWQQAQIGLVGQLNEFFDFVLTSSLIAMLHEYGVGAQPINSGQRVGTVLIPAPTPAAALTDSDIQLQLQTWLANRVLPNPTANTLYFLYLAPGVTVQEQGFTSCKLRPKGMCGYHSNIGDSIFYAVIPFLSCPACGFGANIFENLTVVSSHELCEAITDTTGEGWWDENTLFEIGDICSASTSRLGIYLVQGEWSNRIGRCVISRWNWTDHGLPPGTQVASAPAVTSWTLNGVQRMNVVFQGSGGNLLGRWWDGNQWNWADAGLPPGTQVASAPAVIVWTLNGVQRMNEIFQGRNGNLLERWWDGNQWSWADDGLPPGTQVGSAPAVAGWILGAVPRMNVFMRGTNGHLLEHSWDGNRWNWADHGLPPGTQVTSTPAVIAWTLNGVQRINVIFQGDNGNLLERWWDGNQWSWADHRLPPGTQVGSAPAIMTWTQIESRFNIFMRGANGNLIELWWV